jgi:hypothetical protein
MHDDGNDNIFDEDNALDFIIYGKLEKREHAQKKGNGGCLSVSMFLLLAAGSSVSVLPEKLFTAQAFLSSICHTFHYFFG